MSNTLRHILGVPIGIILTVATWLGFGWAGYYLANVFNQHFGLVLSGLVLLALLTIAVLAVLLGLATSARFMSPVAALIPGVVFLVLSFAQLLLRSIPVAALRGPVDFLFDLGPGQTGLSTFSLSAQGVYPLLGLLLIVSAIPPHRWRAKRGPVARKYADYLPDAPPPTHHLSGAPIDGPGPRPPARPARGPAAQPPAPGYPADDRPAPPDPGQ